MSGIDPRLDPTSEEFDPVFALNSEETYLPVPDAPSFDSVSAFEKHLKEESGEQKPEQPKKVKPKVTLRLPPQPVPPPPKERKRDVVKFMETVQGPLAVLRDCMERGARIKVRTRGASGVRGEVTAYVTAFDKMWNLSLEDCHEIWTRSRNLKKIPPLVSATKEPKWRVNPPRVEVTPIDKKTERCERRVPKLLMRGEHVVHVQVLG